MRMTGETIPLLVGAGLGVGVLAGVVSGVCFLLANGLGWSRRVHRGAVLKLEGSAEDSCAACGGNSNTECSSCTLPVCNSCVDDDQGSLRCRPCTNDRLVFTSSLTRSNSFLHLLKETFTFRPPTDENLNQLKVARTPGGVQTPAATAATATTGLDEGRQIRDFLQHLAEKLTGGSLDDVSVTRMYQNPEYDRMFRSYHRPVCSAISSLSVALRSSSRNLPVTNMESASSAHSRLQQLIQRIIEEALHLPAFLDYSGNIRDKNGKLPEFNPKTYEDLLATAILNKVIDRYQQDPKRSTGASSSGVHSGSSSPGCEEIPLAARAARRRGRPRTSARGSIELDRSSPEPASHDDYINSDSSGRASASLKPTFLKNTYSSDEDDASDSLYKDPVEVALSTINFKNKTRVAFPEYGGDVIELDGVPTSKTFVSENIVDTNGALNNNTDIYTNNNSWEENWLFQKKKIKNSQSVSVPMLVPNPNTEYRALIGDRDAEDTTDLSDAGSESDDKLDDSTDIKKVLINSKTIIGGKNPVLALIDQDINEDDSVKLDNKKVSELNMANNDSYEIAPKAEIKETNNNISVFNVETNKQSINMDDTQKSLMRSNHNGTVIDSSANNDYEINKINASKHNANIDDLSQDLTNGNQLLTRDVKSVVDSSPRNESNDGDISEKHNNLNNSENGSKVSNDENQAQDIIVYDSDEEITVSDIKLRIDSSSQEIDGEVEQETKPKTTIDSLRYILDDIMEDIETMSGPTSPDFNNKPPIIVTTHEDVKQTDPEEYINLVSKLLILNVSNEDAMNGQIEEIKYNKSEINTREANNNEISNDEIHTEEVKSENTFEGDIAEVSQSHTDNTLNHVETQDVCTQETKTDKATVTVIPNDISEIKIKDSKNVLADEMHQNDVGNIIENESIKLSQEANNYEMANVETVCENESITKDSHIDSAHSEKINNLDEAVVKGISSQVDEIIIQAIKDNIAVKTADQENENVPQISETSPVVITNDSIVQHSPGSEMCYQDTIDDVPSIQADITEFSVQIIETTSETNAAETENISSIMEITSVKHRPEITEVDNKQDTATMKETVEENSAGELVEKEVRNEGEKEPKTINSVQNLIQSLHNDEVDTSLPSIEVQTNSFISKNVNEATNLDVDDKQDADGHQRDSEYLETITVPVQRHMDSLKRQHHIRDDGDEPSFTNLRMSKQKEEINEETFIPDEPLNKVRDYAAMNGSEYNLNDEESTVPSGSIAEREHKKWLNAVPMENNPYSPEAIERRLSKQNKSPLFDIVPKTPNPSLDQELEEVEPMTKPLEEAFSGDVTEIKRYGRDYYINQSKNANGASNGHSESLLTKRSFEEHDNVEVERPAFIRSSSEAPTSTWRKTEDCVANNHADTIERSHSQIEVYSPKLTKEQDGVYSAIPATSEPDLYSATPVLVENVVDEQFNKVFDTTFDKDNTVVTNDSCNGNDDSKLINVTNGSLISQSDFSDQSISSPDDSMHVYNIQSGKAFTETTVTHPVEIITNDDEENVNDNNEGDDFVEGKITSSMLNNINKSWKSTGDVYLAAIENKEIKEKVNIIEEDIDLPSVKDLRMKFVVESKTEMPEVKPRRRTSKEFPSSAITKMYSNSQSNLRQPLHMHSLTARSIPKEFRDELKLSMPAHTNIHPGGSKEIPEGAGDPIKEGKNDRPSSPQPEPGSLKNKLAFFEKLNQK